MCQHQLDGGCMAHDNPSTIEYHASTTFFSCHSTALRTYSPCREPCREVRITMYYWNTWHGYVLLSRFFKHFRSSFFGFSSASSFFSFLFFFFLRLLLLLFHHLRFHSPRFCYFSWLVFIHHSDLSCRFLCQNGVLNRLALWLGWLLVIWDKWISRSPVYIRVWNWTAYIELEKQLIYVYLYTRSV